MFHPHFLRLFFGIPHTTEEAMGVIATFKVEEDLQNVRARENAEQYKPVDDNKKAERK